MMRQARDPVVARALEQVRAPEPEPGFWSALEHRLSVGAASRADGRGRDVDLDVAEAPVALDSPSPGRGRRTARLVAVAAVLAVIVAAAGLAATRREPGVDIVTPASPTTEPATPTTTTASPPGSDEAVLGFLDALGSGDFTTAANRLGPLSERYLVATAGSPERFLREAEEGLGAWAGARDRSVRVIEVRPGDVVVVLSGQVQVEGSIENRVTAFPARYSPSSGVWFVEPWALDPNSGRLDWAQPDRDVVAVTTPAAGTLWVLDADGHPSGRWPNERPVAQPTTVNVDLGCCPGQHTLVVAFINDTTFTALAQPVDIGR